MIGILQAPAVSGPGLCCTRKDVGQDVWSTIQENFTLGLCCEIKLPGDRGYRIHFKVPVMPSQTIVHMMQCTALNFCSAIVCTACLYGYACVSLHTCIIAQTSLPTCVQSVL